MKLKRIINILILTFSIMTIFSCSHLSNHNKNIKNKGIIDIHLKKNKRNLTEISSTQLMLQNLYKNNIVYFDSNKSCINPIFLKYLDIIANFLCNKTKNNICIEGHADKNGPCKYNFLLAEKRVKEIRSYLIKKGVPDKQISFVVYGKDKPVIDCNTELCYMNNRRVVIIFY